MIPNLELILYKSFITQSYKLNYINPILLVTVVNIITGPIHWQAVLLEYIDLFNLNHNGNIKQIFGRSSLSLASHYLIFKPLIIWNSKQVALGLMFVVKKFPLLCWKFLLLCWHYAMLFSPYYALSYASIIDSTNIEQHIMNSEQHWVNTRNT